MNRERLLNVAKALRESKNPGHFTMSCYGNECGTPACALGHYSSRRDLQTSFALDPENDMVFSCGPLQDPDPCYAEDNTIVGYDGNEILLHFGIDWNDAALLFGPEGCGNAQTALEAAEYIEAFVARDGAAGDAPEGDLS